VNVAQLERGQASRLYSKVADLVRWLKAGLLSQYKVNSNTR
jgi:hypothetical protein